MTEAEGDAICDAVLTVLHLVDRALRQTRYGLEESTHIYIEPDVLDVVRGRA